MRKYFHSKIYFFNTRGVTALLTVIVVSAAALLMAFGAAMLGLGDADMSFAAQKGFQTSALADGCVEESLRRLQINSDWSGGTLSLGDGSCIIAVVSEDAIRIIQVKATVGNFHKSKLIKILLTNQVVEVLAWQEIN